MKLKIKANHQGWTGYCTLYAAINAAYQMINVQNDENYPQNIKGFKKFMEGRDYFVDEKSKDGYSTVDRDATFKVLKGISEFNPEGYEISFKRVLSIPRKIQQIKDDLDKGRTAIMVLNGSIVKTGKTNAYLDFSKKSGFDHATALFDYDNDGLIGINSYGRKWGYYKNGTFKILWEDIKKIRLMYFLIENNMIFKDVPEDYIFAEEIRDFQKLGLIKGYSAEGITDIRDRKFKPNQPITRGEQVAILHRALKKFKLIK